MDLSEVASVSTAAGAPGWDARLTLGYERSAARTVLTRREHMGPLRVQRNLYPEGGGTCHTIVVHPPGGIAGGDRLAIAATLGESSAALLTTPGAGKWYRSLGRPASQSLEFALGAGASLEWLPQETIVFNGAMADMETRVQLSGDAAYVGWDIVCFGRTASGERFARGSLRTRTEISRDGRRLWLEQGRLEGDDSLFASPVGLAGRTVCGTLLAAGRDVPAELLAACRAVPVVEGALAGITRLPGVCIARWLGDSSEDARRWFAAQWALLRPVFHGGSAESPRIWAT
ncbi:MAG: urease accessory protein UreD [Betaproteobacteria bacterium]|nr:urease accessory protein UreD [Betaproteobacteria bacterium]